MKAFSMALVLAAAGACASPGQNGTPPAPRAPAPVRISGARGAMLGHAEIHNDPRIVKRTVAAPRDSVWRTLPNVYGILGIPDAGGDPQQEVYGNQQFRPKRIEGARLSSYIDCGMGFTAVPKADDYEITLSVLTYLMPAEDGRTVIATTVIATGKPRDLSGNAVHCPSKGTLEARIVELVLRELSGDG